MICIIYFEIRTRDKKKENIIIFFLGKKEKEKNARFL